MNSLKILVFSFPLTICLTLQAFAAQQAATDTELVARAARVERVMAEIETDYLLGRTTQKSYTLAESDLNAFLAQEVGKVPETGLKGLSVSLEGGNSFVTDLIVDPQQIQIGGSMMGSLLQSLLSGEQNLVVKGVLTTQDGKGTYEVTSASLNGVPVPAAVVETALRTIGGRLDPPFDPTAGFTFEYGIREIVVDRGKAVIHTGK